MAADFSSKRNKSLRRKSQPSEMKCRCSGEVRSSASRRKLRSVVQGPCEPAIVRDAGMPVWYLHSSCIAVLNVEHRCVLSLAGGTVIAGTGRDDSTVVSLLLLTAHIAAV